MSDGVFDDVVDIAVGVVFVVVVVVDVVVGGGGGFIENVVAIDI